MTREGEGRAEINCILSCKLQQTIDIRSGLRVASHPTSFILSAVTGCRYIMVPSPGPSDDILHKAESIMNTIESANANTIIDYN